MDSAPVRLPDLETGLEKDSLATQAELQSSTDTEHSREIPVEAEKRDSLSSPDDSSDDEVSGIGNAPGSSPLAQTQTQQSTKSQSRQNNTSLRLQKTISLVRTKDSGIDPGPPPDGGWHACLQACLGHFIIFICWGSVNSFGLFETYYVTALDRPPSDIAWIGSVEIFCLFFIGSVSGRATDAGFLKITLWTGTFFLCLGVFMTSLGTQYWQILLAQGFCQGLGAGMLFCPTVALVSTYFQRNRALAIGFAASGR